MKTGWYSYDVAIRSRAIAPGAIVKHNPTGLTATMVENSYFAIKVELDDKKLEWWFKSEIVVEITE